MTHHSEPCGHHPGQLCGQLVETAATAEHLPLLTAGCHYDYRAQAWIDGHDHAHMCSAEAALGLLFCGAELVTCSIGRQRPES